MVLSSNLQVQPAISLLVFSKLTFFGNPISGRVFGGIIPQVDGLIISILEQYIIAIFRSAE